MDLETSKDAHCLVGYDKKKHTFYASLALHIRKYHDLETFSDYYLEFFAEAYGTMEKLDSEPGEEWIPTDSEKPAYSAIARDDIEGAIKQVEERANVFCSAVFTPDEIHEACINGMENMMAMIDYA